MDLKKHYTFGLTLLQLMTLIAVVTLAVSGIYYCCST